MARISRLLVFVLALLILLAAPFSWAPTALGQTIEQLAVDEQIIAAEDPLRSVPIVPSCSTGVPAVDPGGIRSKPNLGRVEVLIKQLAYEIENLRRLEEQGTDDSLKASERQATLNRLQKTADALRDIKRDLSLPQ